MNKDWNPEDNTPEDDEILHLFKEELASCKTNEEKLAYLKKMIEET